MHGFNAELIIWISVYQKVYVVYSNSPLHTTSALAISYPAFFFFLAFFFTTWLLFISLFVYYLLV